MMYQLYDVGHWFFELDRAGSTLAFAAHANVKAKPTMDTMCIVKYRVYTGLIERMSKEE